MFQDAITAIASVIKKPFVWFFGIFITIFMLNEISVVLFYISNFVGGFQLAPQTIFENLDFMGLVLSQNGIPFISLALILFFLGTLFDIWLILSARTTILKTLSIKEYIKDSVRFFLPVCAINIVLVACIYGFLLLFTAFVDESSIFFSSLPFLVFYGILSTAITVLYSIYAKLSKRIIVVEKENILIAFKKSFHYSIKQPKKLILLVVATFCITIVAGLFVILFSNIVFLLFGYFFKSKFIFYSVVIINMIVFIAAKALSNASQSVLWTSLYLKK
ncbi:MAG: hypothetical protein HYW78_03580 [Parcubacteria group bacterium]|nr:hypothetical protein [Parcubacteria group bacterium]